MNVINGMIFNDPRNCNHSLIIQSDYGDQSSFLVVVSIDSPPWGLYDMVPQNMLRHVEGKRKENSNFDCC